MQVYRAPLQLSNEQVKTVLVRYVIRQSTIYVGFLQNEHVKTGSRRNAVNGLFFKMFVA